MDGFCMQQTDFPFVCVIVDDASTDGEQDVIRDYLQINFDLGESNGMQTEVTDDYISVFARHKTNTNCFFEVFFLKNNHYQVGKSKAIYFDKLAEGVKYIAICEGDDYWIDSMKLQKQVDFMDSHAEHSLCFCAHKNLFPSGELAIENRYEKNVEQCPMKDIILGGGGYMATNSMLYRQSLYVTYQSWAVGCPVGDLPMMLSLSHKGKVGFLADVMCVYRRSAVGSWSTRMASSLKTRRRHYRAVNKMWHQFDAWSGNQYHDIVLQKIRKNQTLHLKDELSTLKNLFLKNESAYSG